MSLINIVAGESPTETIRIWFESYHPEYPIEQVAFWEEQVIRDQCDPYACIYNVVYFLDAEHHAYMIMHMELYGKWEPQQFPAPLSQPKLPAPVVVWSSAPVESFQCDMWSLKERVDWIFAGGNRICFPDDAELGTLISSFFAHCASLWDFF